MEKFSVLFSLHWPKSAVHSHAMSIKRTIANGHDSQAQWPSDGLGVYFGVNMIIVLIIPILLILLALGYLQSLLMETQALHSAWENAWQQMLFNQRPVYFKEKEDARLSSEQIHLFENEFVIKISDRNLKKDDKGVLK